MAAVRNLLVRAGADFSNMQKSLRKAQQDLNNFKKNVSTTMKGIGTALAGLGIGISFKAAINEAMQFEASLQQINRIMGENANSFRRWVDENASALGMARSELIRYGATFGNLISTFATSTEQVQRYTQDLLRTASIVSSGTGRTIEDVMERIRSGILGSTEAIEDLSINVNVAMLESTRAFKQFAGNRSWQQLDFQTQQTIRYFAILEQAAAKYGTELISNTAANQAAFIAELKNAQLALGQAFLPIYNIVLPALTSMARALAQTMQYIAAFSEALFGSSSQQQQIKATQDQAKAVASVGDAYEEAGKKAKGSVASFDEVNQLTESQSGDGASPIAGIAQGITGQAIDVAEQTDKIANKAEEMAEKVRNVINGLANDPNVLKMKQAFEGLKAAISNFGQAISNFISNPSVQKFTRWVAETLRESFIKARISDLQITTGVIQSWTGFFEILDGIIKLDFGTVTQGLKDWVAGIGETIEGFVRMFSPSMADRFASFKKWIREVWDEIKNIKWSDIRESIIKTWDELKTQTGEKWNAFKGVISERWQSIVNSSNWNAIKESIVLSWDNLKTQTGERWDALKVFINEKWEAIKVFIHWDDIMNLIVESWVKLKTQTGEKWNDLKTEISERWQAIVNMDYNGVKDGLISIWNSLKIETGRIWGAIKDEIKSTINAMIELINKFIGHWNNIKVDVPKVDLGPLGSWGGFTFSVPKLPTIPKLARGGIVTSPTVAMIGEAGAEAVVPLENTAFVDTLATALGNAVMNAMSMSMQMNASPDRNAGDIILQLDGVTFARIVNPYLDREQSRQGTRVIVKPS